MLKIFIIKVIHFLFTLPYNVHREIRQIASKHTRYALGISSYRDWKSVFYKKQKQKNTGILLAKLTISEFLLTYIL